MCGLLLQLVHVRHLEEPAAADQAAVRHRQHLEPGPELSRETPGTSAPTFQKRRWGSRERGGALLLWQGLHLTLNLFSPHLGSFPFIKLVGEPRQRRRGSLYCGK
jgi:hypothetical protein